MCTGSKDRSFFILSKHLINIYLQTNLLKLVGDILIGQSCYKKTKKYFMHDLKASSYIFRKSRSEYTANYKSPKKFKVVHGAWKGADPPQLQPQV
jgi:uncharacterized protein (DUF2461 family)